MTNFINAELVLDSSDDSDSERLLVIVYFINNCS